MATISAPGQSNAQLAQADRPCYIWLSGAGTCSAQIEFSIDGSTWYPIFVEGTQMGMITYAGTAFVQVLPPVSGFKRLFRINFTAVTGTVIYEYTQ